MYLTLAIPSRFPAICIPCLKILYFYNSSLCASWISLHSQTGHIDYYNITSLHTAYQIHGVLDQKRYEWKH